MTKNLTSVVEVLKAVPDYSDRTMFRGQCKNWPLRPAIARFDEQLSGFSNWRIFHEHLLERFKRYSRPHFSDMPRTDVEWLIHAQHHGLPTRLLDWTTNPLKALFFAVDDPECDADEGVFWSLEPDGWWEDFGQHNQKWWEAELAAFFPEHLNSRLIAQEGCFLSFPMDENTDPIKPLDVAGSPYKVKEISCWIVPSSSKRSIRQELSLLGISHRTMFPDLDGIAKSIRLNPNAS